MISRQTLNLTSKLAFIPPLFSTPLKTLSQPNHLAALYAVKGCQP
jgi:hypothetical protein